MRFALRFSRLAPDVSLPGIVLPCTPDVYDEVLRGRAYEVESDAFSDLKRLKSNSSVFFLIDAGTETARFIGRFRLRSPPVLDADTSNEQYFAKLRVEPVRAVSEMTEAAFRMAVGDAFVSETQFLSDLNALQLKNIVRAMSGEEPPRQQTFPSENRRGGTYEASRYRRQWDDEERGAYGGESSRPWSGYSSYADRRSQRSEPWEQDPSSGRVSPARLHGNESEAWFLRIGRPVHAETQTEEDDRLAELRSVMNRLSIQNADLVAQIENKDGKIAEMGEEVRRIRAVLFEKFHIAAYGSGGESPEPNHGPVESEHREAPIAPEPAAVRTVDSPHLSPRSTYAQQFLPPPLQSGRAYSPGPGQASPTRAASPQWPSNESLPPHSLPPVQPPPLSHMGRASPATHLPPPLTAQQPVASYPGPFPPHGSQPYPYPTASSWSMPPSYPPYDASAPAAASPPAPPQPAALPRPVVSTAQTGAAATSLPPVGVSTKRMAILGGLLGRGQCHTMDVFRPELSSWSQLLTFPEGTAANVWPLLMVLYSGIKLVMGGASVMGRNLYVITGLESPRTPATTGHRYSFDSSTWETIMPMSQPRLGIISAELGGKLYLVGEVHNAINAADLYLPSIDRWQSLPPPNEIRGRHAMASNADLDLVFIFGGENGNGAPADTVEQYDPREGAWSVVGRMPTASSGMCGSAAAESLYIAGGWLTGFSGQLFRSVDIFDLRNRKWTVGPDMNYARSGARMLCLQDEFYIVGGYDSHKQPLKMERLGRRGQWETDITDGTIDARTFHSLVTIPSDLVS